MKKALSIIALTALPIFFTTTANADFLRIEGGIGGWNAEPSGTIQYRDSIDFDVADAAGLESETNAYAWVYVKHFIPLVPNLRLEYVDPTFSGSIIDIPDVDAGLNNELALTQYDAVLYYNLLDNLFWATLDLGLDIKYIDGNYKVDANVGDSSSGFDEGFSLVTPLLYGRVRAQLPLTGLAVEAIARGMSYSDSTVVDASIKIDYTMEFIPIIQPGLELGYRYQKLELDAGGLDINANINTEFSGVYAGVMVRF